jgi:hypothetical protein
MRSYSLIMEVFSLKSELMFVQVIFLSGYIVEYG